MWMSSFMALKMDSLRKYCFQKKMTEEKWTRVNQENGIQIKLKIASSSSNE